MKKRLRKKLGRKEFLKNGFPVSLILWLTKEDSRELDDFWNKLIISIETKGLLIIGVVDTFFVFTDYKILPERAATDGDRCWMRDWLLQQSEVDGFWVGPTTATWRPADGPF